jgi:acyl dehydratase
MGARDHSLPVERGHVLMFARAIGDPNAIYYSPEAAMECGYGDVVAPPTFVQSIAHFDPDYHQRPRIGEPWRGSGKFATGIPDAPAVGTRLHAEQHFTYHRPVLAGDVLTPVVVARSEWEKDGRSGHLVFTEVTTEYRDQNGEIALSSRSVSVVTEQKASSPAEGHNHSPS